MVDYQRQLLDELMGRNRNLDPSQKHIKVNCFNGEFCPYYLVKFCPNDLFINTKADLGICNKLHDEEAKKLYEEEKQQGKKNEYEDEFLRFCTNMINEVDRKIVKGRQRLDLMNSKLENRPVSKQQDQINNINEKVKKLVREAEEAGIRGDVEQAQGLMNLCDKLKEDKEALLKQYEQSGWNISGEFGHQEKQMEVCEVCGAFLIVGDAQQRIDDHLTGKQHIGYTRLRKAIEEFYEKRKKARDERSTVDDDRRGGRRHDSGRSSRYNRDDKGRRSDDRDRRGGSSRDGGSRHHRDRNYRSDRHRSDRSSRDKHRERDRRSRSRSKSH